ncbi:hypothetical protein G6F59_015761 [Rhizopus arrhizus]|nr:hypothetical protein G6F59_015761 [Rhizopus arrhizus]
MAADHVEMQLAHDVAQRADVDLLHAVGALQGLAGAVELGAQLVLLLAVQLDPLGHPGQARYQHQPGESFVVHQPHLRQRSFGHQHAIGGQA